MADNSDEELEAPVDAPEDDDAVLDTDNIDELAALAQAEAEADDDSPGLLNMDREVVPAEARITSDVISPFELCQVVATRIEQIGQTGRALATPPPGGFKTPEEIAMAEIHQKKCPFVVERLVRTYINPVSGRHTQVFEYWPVNELIVPK